MPVPRELALNLHDLDFRPRMWILESQGTRLLR
jgi:hypothetical protein